MIKQTRADREIKGIVMLGARKKNPNSLMMLGDKVNVDR
jgi:hypothetical protein